MITFLRKLLWYRERRRKEAELREELEFHLDEEAGDRQELGLTPDAARLAARRDLGNLSLVQEDTRSSWGWIALEQLAQDIRYAVRTMRANPVFTMLAVCSLALGIGANTAIYSFVDAILLRALPVRDPQSLVMLNWRARDVKKGSFVMHSMSGQLWGAPGTQESGMFPYPAFELFQQRTDLFSDIFGFYRTWRVKRLNVSTGGQADIAAGTFVSGGYFTGLGVAPAGGRLILPDDDRMGGPSVVVVSHAFSEKHLGGAAQAAGRKVLIDNLPFTVIGVTPAGFFGVDPAYVPDVYLPVHTAEVLGANDQFGFRPKGYLERNSYWIQTMARLRPGVTARQAENALAPQFREWVAGTASNDQERGNLPVLLVNNGAGGLGGLRREYSQPLYILMALVGLILALACANVANLLLARSAARRREMALRLSVGAGRGRVIRQLLTESILLASIGGVLGVWLAVFGMHFLTRLLGNGESSFTLHAELNWHVLAAAAGLSLFTGVVFGVAPALRATRVDVMPTLREVRTASSSRRGLGMGNLLVAFQVAISLLMLVAAGLFVRSLTQFRSIELGFERENILLFQLDARKAGHKDPEIAEFYAGLRRRFAEIRGVRIASLSEDSLLEAGTGLYVDPPGRRDPHGTRILNVGQDFLHTMGVPLKSGRDFDERDRPGAPAVAVINEAYAQEIFPGQNPLGQHLILRRSENTVDRDMEIVGVCGNVRYGLMTRKMEPVVFLAYNQGYPKPDAMVFELRTQGNPMRYAAAIQEIVRKADPRIPVAEMRTQTMEIDRQINQPITFAGLCTGFALLALAIACVGLYGTVSYNVARRSAEIGIRMALGAQRGGVVRMVLRDVLLLAVAGLAIGMAAAWNTSRFVKTFLYGIESHDPMALTTAGATLLAAALVAAYLPARKASRIDPMSALRNE